MAPQKYPVGEQSFKSIREAGKVYVDKTLLIYELTHGAKNVFLARPRRFGKSLLLSTIKAYFEGRKELFEGLAISNLEKEWKKYPVLHLSFVNFNASNPESLNHIFEYQFKQWEKEYEIPDSGLDYPQRFQRIIKKSSEKSGSRVVILIDEYDHALLNTLHKEEIHERNKETLKAVYSNLKDLDEYIRFAMLTGVSRFSKAGIFSGLNNLYDITFDKKYSAICGFTKEEIRQYFWPGVETLAESENVSPEAALGMLKTAYDGYHFSEDLTDVYNPFSLLNAFAHNNIANYWIESGTPTFLVKRLEGLESEPFVQLFNDEADTSDLAAVDTAFSSPLALLYQTGYLTIKSYDKGERLYRLGVPNKEVREGFFSVLLAGMSNRERRKGIRETKAMKSCLEDGRIDEFMERLQAFCAGISYQMMPKAPELYFENTLYVILELAGLEVRAEDESSRGRTDLTVKTDKYIYIIEIKKDKSSEEALAQIERKEYSLKYKFDGRQVIAVGISFSSEKRNIDNWKFKKIF